MKMIRYLILGMLIASGYSCAQQYIQPESITYDPSTKCYFVSNFGGSSIVRIDSAGNKSYFKQGLSKPLGMIVSDDILYVIENPVTVSGYHISDAQVVFRIVINEALFLNDITSDDARCLYVSDSNAVYKIDVAAQTYSLFIRTELDNANGILYDPSQHRLLLCYFTEPSLVDEIPLDNPALLTLVNTGMINLDGISMDDQGNFYVSSWKSGSFNSGFSRRGVIYRFDPSFSRAPELVVSNLYGPADIYYNTWKHELAIPLFLDNKINIVPAALLAPYLGQEPPAEEPLLFAPGIVSIDGRYEYGLTVSPDGNEIYFSAESPGEGLTVITRIDGRWSAPATANLRGNHSWEFEAFYTVNGEKLFFTSDTANESKFWYIEKTSSGWTPAQYLDSPINNTSVMWCTFTTDQTMYYGNNSNFQIHRAKWENGKYTQPENLGFNGSHPTIAPDESFFLFNSSRYGGNGKSDIFIVFKKGDNSWTAPMNLGKKINTGYNETCASLSPDGQYIFFSRYNEPGEKCNIYWVSSAIIDTLKGTLSHVDEKNNLPEGMNLYQNYPNPFNPMTSFCYQLPTSGNIELAIYNFLGQKIKTLENGFQDAGIHSVSWDAKDEGNNFVGSGVYFYKLHTGYGRVQRKMLLVR